MKLSIWEEPRGKKRMMTMHDLGIWLFGAMVGGCVGFLWAALIRAAGKQTCDSERNDGNP